MVESYERRSEQKPSRYFSKGSRIALVQALPQEDSSWLDLLTAEEAFHIPEESTAQHLGVRTFTLRCGCDARKIAATLLAAHEGSIDLLFGADPSLEVECPRCGARLVLTREDCGGTSS
jgi:molecular chaperone Hsp33